MQVKRMPPSKLKPKILKNFYQRKNLIPRCWFQISSQLTLLKELDKAKNILREKNSDTEKTAIFGACATVNVMIEMGKLAEDIDFIIDNSHTDRTLTSKL